MKEGPKSAVVLNPTAAHGRVGRYQEAILNELQTVWGPFELLVTERPEQAAPWVSARLREGHFRVASVGGDGTLNEVLNGFFAGKQPISPGACLACIPYGTGGDFARTIGLKGGMHAIKHLGHAAPRQVDVGCVTHGLADGGEAVRYFLNVADFGAGGAVVQRVNRSSKRFGGFLTFLSAVIATLATYKNPLVHLEIDGEPVEGYINNVIVANGQFYGGGMHVAPEARLDSGEFEVYVIGDVGRLEAVVNLPKLYRGRLLRRADKVSYYLAKRIVARSDDTVLLDLDGEQPGRLPATFEILPGALRILC